MADEGGWTEEDGGGGGEAGACLDGRWQANVR